ncbi:MAG: tetratricopeptide repeat protein [Bradyrhizobium sp.]|uniref:O-linked N-acetylglucosamine transferase, SPINDLY family protein n=1 Tax=Bradyrhizobium sp. TaxID=376 RepID=UPI003C74D1DA
MSENFGSRAFHNARLPKKKKQAEALLPGAIAAYQRGDYGEAKMLCRRILRDRPDHFDALHLLGVLELDGPRVDDAEKFLQRAVKVQPRSAEAHSNLGLAWAKLKRFEEARKCQETAIALNPNSPTALTNLGNVLMRLRRYELAVEAHERAIRLKPDYADAYNNRGMALLLLGRHATADASFDRALSLQPRHLAALVGKAMVSMCLRHLDAAQRALDAASAINPHVPEALVHRGRLKMVLGKFDEAEADFDAALAIDPALESAWESKAHHGLLTSKVAQAIHACHKVLESNPDSEVAIGFLGSCHAAQGDMATALQLFDRALVLRPDFDDVMLKKIFVMDYLEDADFAAHQAVRREWWDRIGSKLPRRDLRPSGLDPEKRIVVGYVSSDFRAHSAALAFIPILRHHDHQKFEIIAYSSSHLRDSTTDQCQALVDVWVDASGLSDDELADRIQRDHVDVLVDLSGHSAGNRLAVFARKPAPIQVSACGSVTGTGLPTMDYLLADPVFVPETVRHLFAEQIHDLPCAITIDAVPSVQPTELPMLRNGFVTFGIFNRTEKISDGALSVWSTILQQIPHSRIVVKNGSLGDSFLRNILLGRFVAYGIEAERVTCLGSTPHAEHLAEFANIDISLDPFPQNGGVSTWESLQMGVPVVSQLGHSACSRAGGAIVKAVGLDDWVAEDDNGYIAIARKYAGLPAELRALRAGLPARVAGSDAGNNERYTRRVEDGYRQFWRSYCAAQG